MEAALAPSPASRVGRLSGPRQPALPGKVAVPQPGTMRPERQIYGLLGCLRPTRRNAVMFLSHEVFDAAPACEVVLTPRARPLRIALAGYGVVGQALAAALANNTAYEIVAILVRDADRVRM